MFEGVVGRWYAMMLYTVIIHTHLSKKILIHLVFYFILFGVGSMTSTLSFSKIN